MKRSMITGTGSAAPEKVLTNRDLERMVETSDEWISTRTGIRERRVSVGETTTSLSSDAAEKALDAAGVGPGEIDLVVTGTVTPDMAFPSVSCFVQKELGIRAGAPAFDVSAACSGFIFALDTADRFMRTGGARKALVIGVDSFSRLVDWTDRSTCVLFGDGAGAVVLEAGEGGRGVLSTHTHSDGRQWEMLYSSGGCLESPFEEAATVEAGRAGKPSRAGRDPYIRMQGNETFKIAVRTMGAAVREALEANGLEPGDVKLLIPHQANRRIIEATRERLGLGEDRVVLNVDRFGNTSAGSIPLALDEAARAGRLTEGDIVLFVAFGGGLTWGSAVVRW